VTTTYTDADRAFLRELADALDAMPERRLIPYALHGDEGVCALGCLVLRRGIDMSAIYLFPGSHTLSNLLGATRLIVQEVSNVNDRGGHKTPPELRWKRVRTWVAKQLAAS